MNELIIVKPEKCVGCHACIRTCPAPEANRAIVLDGDRTIVTVDPQRCIACGVCVKTCQHSARDYIDDTEEAMAAISREKVIIMVDPAIKTVFPTRWKGILDWFRGQGCLIYDVAFGADICTWAHLRALEQNPGNHLITQPCSAIVNYIEMYQPKLLTNLSRIHSPVCCNAIYVKQYLRRTEKIAMLSPCVAKKLEFEETGLLDFNVTFRKLMEYFDKNDIRIPVSPVENYEYKFDDEQGQFGSVYSRPGGLRDNLWLHNPEMSIFTSEGVHKVYSELEMYAKIPENKHPEVFDVLSCEFGCNVGPGTGSEQTMFDAMNTMRDVEREAKNRRKTTGGMFRGAGEDKLFKRFDEELNLADFIRTYKPGKQSPLPTDAELDPIFAQLGKHTEADRSYDCHACGYQSCREMATAIFRGLNRPENCIVHAKSVLLERHSKLSEQHDRLAEITAECLSLSDRLKHDIDEITENMSTIGDSTNATKERAEVVSDLLRNVVAFCSSRSTMDTDSVQQLVGILETTIDAFGVLDDNVTATNESSGMIHASIAEITGLVDAINETLQTSSENQKEYEAV
ncbi:MAG: 4Fe-4S binding protein [Oscillospiraceae bacterium]|nr:4Fe-4S binding protein [Oscillospiraceae bacterium]